MAELIADIRAGRLDDAASLDVAALGSDHFRPLWLDRADDRQFPQRLPIRRIWARKIEVALIPIPPPRPYNDARDPVIHSRRCMTSAAVAAFIRDPRSYLAMRAAEYSRTRYLERAGPELLDIRERDLYANTWTTDNNGSVRAIPDPARREFFFSKIVELEKERRLRAQSSDNIQFDEAAISRLASRDYTPIRPARHLVFPLPHFSFGTAKSVTLRMP